MTRSHLRVATLIMAVTITLPLLAQPRDRDMWIGVLLYDGLDHGDPPSKVSVALYPVATLHRGAWLANPDVASGDPHENERPATVRWSDLVRNLPRRWVAWLDDGRRENFERSGSPRPMGPFDMAAVRTSIRPSPPPQDAHSGDVLGIAVAGQVKVRLFSNVTGAAREVVPAVMRQAMLEAEVKEITTRTAGQTSASYRMAADVPRARLASAPYEVELHRVAVRVNGARTSIFEGFKKLAHTEGCNSLRSGAAIEERGGSVRVLGAWSYLVCEEMWISYLPLAILERDDYACWIGEHRYEDGVNYVLQQPEWSTARRHHAVSFGRHRLAHTVSRERNGRPPQRWEAP